MPVPKHYYPCVIPIPPDVGVNRTGIRRDKQNHLNNRDQHLVNITHPTGRGGQTPFLVGFPLCPQPSQVHEQADLPRQNITDNLALWFFPLHGTETLTCPLPCPAPLPRFSPNPSYPVPSWTDVPITGRRRWANGWNDGVACVAWVGVVCIRHVCVA